MKKFLLACDLDNTLIYSYKHRVPGDSCVEWLDGQEQSFMTALTQRLLPEAAAKLRLIPVTTRSVAQYQRICWPGEQPQWAVTTNGGLLLKNDELDVLWQAQTAEQAAPYKTALAELEAKLEAAYSKRRLVDDIYLYTVCRDVAEAELCVAEFADYADLQVLRGGRKVYFLPPEINKGAAVGRLRQLWPGYSVIAAGDSELDLPMLEQADIALLPNEQLAAQLANPQRYICPAEAHFAEFVLQTALRLITDDFSE